MLRGEVKSARREAEVFTYHIVIPVFNAAYTVSSYAALRLAMNAVDRCGRDLLAVINPTSLPRDREGCGHLQSGGARVLSTSHPT